MILLVVSNLLEMQQATVSMMPCPIARSIALSHMEGREISGQCASCQKYELCVIQDIDKSLTEFKLSQRVSLYLYRTKCLLVCSQCARWDTGKGIANAIIFLMIQNYLLAI